MSFINELKRRNVLRVGLAYLAGAWLLIQIAETIFPLFGLPDAAARVVVQVIAIGFIPALIFAWIFEITSEGLKRDAEVNRSDARTTGKKADRIIMLLMALALAFFGIDKFILDPARDIEREEQVAREVRSEALTESYGEKSIAVMPFVNMSDDESNEFFADGISEELLNLLAAVSDLRVISRTSAFSFKGKQIDLPTVARQLNVAHILEGSVRMSGNKVRITAQLIEANSDTHLWSATYDRTLDDIFATQDEIAAKVVEELKATLLGDADRRSKVNPDAYSMFLQARYILNLYDPEKTNEAQSLLLNALEIEPDYVEALLALARSYYHQSMFGLRATDEAVQLAEKASEKARAIDPYDATVLMVATPADDMASESLNYARALELEPRNTFIVETVSRWAREIGRLDEAIALSEYLVDRDPLCGRCYFRLGMAYYRAGRFDEAEVSFRTAQTLGAGKLDPNVVLGSILLLKGDALAALSHFDSMDESLFVASGRTMALHDLGRKAEFDAAFSELQARNDEGSDFEIATVRAWIGDSDLAFEMLDRQFEKYGSEIGEIAHDPYFHKLHDDSRWIPFLEKTGYAPEQLAAIPFDITIPE